MRLIGLLLAAAVFLGLLVRPHRTGPTEVGVRTVKWSPLGGRGVQPDVYQPGGVYFFPGFINDWHTFDTRLQNIEMTMDPQRGDRSSKDDLRFKTIDGNDIELDLIVSYRVDPDKAPFILQQVADSDFALRDNVVRSVTRSRPRDIFGELKTEDFYISDLREKKAEQAKQVLNQMLNPYGVIVERVSTKDYRFNTAYTQAIEDRKVADQVAEQNKAATKAAQEEYRRRVEDAKGEVSKMVAEADGRFRQAQIEADAYYEQQQRLAEAIEAEGVAEAKGVAEMNKALAGSGGEIMVKLKIAEALAGKKIMLLPVSGSGIDLKTTNMNQLLQTYGLMKAAE
jgi:regulator of protease activity HflC (stomatin/prohibitin superfamily)